MCKHKAPGTMSPTCLSDIRHSFCVRTPFDQLSRHPKQHQPCVPLPAEMLYCQCIITCKGKAESHHTLQRPQYREFLQCLFFLSILLRMWMARSSGPSFFVTSYLLLWLLLLLLRVLLTLGPCQAVLSVAMVSAGEAGGSIPVLRAASAHPGTFPCHRQVHFTVSKSLSTCMHTFYQYGDHSCVKSKSKPEENPAANHVCFAALLQLTAQSVEVPTETDKQENKHAYAVAALCLFLHSHISFACTLCPNPSTPLPCVFV